MEYCLAVFVNRFECQMFSKKLNSMRLPNTIISTPRELGMSCGLSVKFNLKNLILAKKVLSGMNYSSFKNFYKIVPLSNYKQTYIKV